MHGSEDVQELDVEEICAAFASNTDEAQNLLWNIVRWSQALQETRPFWQGKSKNLQAYVQQLGCPAFLFTLSAADNHWDSLMRHFDNWDAWLTATPIQRHCMARQNVISHHHITTHNFDVHVRAVMDQILTPKFNVVDY